MTQRQAEPSRSIPKMIPKMLNVHRAAEYYGFPESTLRRWAIKKKVPSVKIGAHWYLNVEQMDKLVRGEINI